MSEIPKFRPDTPGNGNDNPATAKPDARPPGRTGVPESGEKTSTTPPERSDRQPTRPTPGQIWSSEGEKTSTRPPDRTSTPRTPETPSKPEAKTEAKPETKSGEKVIYTRPKAKTRPSRVPSTGSRRPTGSRPEGRISIPIKAGYDIAKQGYKNHKKRREFVKYGGTRRDAKHVSEHNGRPVMSWGHEGRGKRGEKNAQAMAKMEKERKAKEAQEAWKRLPPHEKIKRRYRAKKNEIKQNVKDQFNVKKRVKKAVKEKKDQIVHDIVHGKPKEKTPTKKSTPKKAA